MSWIFSSKFGKERGVKSPFFLLNIRVFYKMLISILRAFTCVLRHFTPVLIVVYQKVEKVH
jgi:hypothetical protein